MDSSKTYGLESALSYMRLDDVANPTLSDDKLGMTTAVVFTASSTTGMIYTVRIGGTADGGGRYARFDVALKPPAAPAASAAAATNAASTNATAQVDEAKKEQEKRAQLEGDIRKLNDKLHAWTYVIASFKTDNMTSTRSTLVKEKKDEKKEEKKEEEKKTESPPPAENH